jgi:hypothetical protein
MNKPIVFILPICLTLSNCTSFSGALDNSTTPPVVTNESGNTKQSFQHGYQIETIGSPSADISRIHVEPVEDGLQITGQITRRTLYKTKKIRGHLDVEIVDTLNQVVKRIAVPIRPSTVHAKHDRSRTFSMVISEPIPKEYRIRIRHNLASGEH